MEKTINLKPKQLEILKAIQGAKTKAQSLFNEAQQREVSIIELVLEMNEVTGMVTKYEIKDNKLVFTVLDKPVSKPEKTKGKEVKEQK